MFIDASCFEKKAYFLLIYDRKLYDDEHIDCVFM